MVPARGLVIVVIILHEEGRVLRHGIDHAARALIAARAEVLRALGVEGAARLKTRLFIVGCVKIPVRRHARHVVHRRCHCCLDARVYRRRVQRHAAPAAYADYADALRVNILLYGQKVHRRLKVLRVYVRRRYISWLTAALAGEGRVEGQRQKAALRHRLRVQAGGLLLHRAERAAHRDSGKPAGVLRRLVHIRRQRDAEADAEGHIAVLHFAAFGKGLVPFFGQNKLFVHNISSMRLLTALYYCDTMTVAHKADFRSRCKIKNFC